MTILRTLCNTFAYLTIATTQIASAQSIPQLSKDNYPSKPIKLIVNQPPGGGNDIIGRLLAQKLTELMEQPVVVENHAGAGGIIGTAFAAKAPSDGYSILLVSTPFAMAPTFYPNLPYDTLKDFSPITEIGSATNMLVVHPSVAAKTVAELLALTHTKSTAVSAATVVGSTQHIAAALFNLMGKTDILLVPYKGTGPAVNDLLAGHVQMMFQSLVAVWPYVKSGRLRALGVTSKKGSSLAPDVPTVAETLPGFEIVTWYGVLVPAGTPASIISQLNAELSRVSKFPDIKKKLLEMGIEIQFSSPGAFGALIKSELVKWAEVIRVTGVKAE